MPWWPALWDHNYFVNRWPWLAPILTNNFVRGGVTGLGLVNLAAGFADLGTVLSARAPNGPHHPMDGGEPQESSGPS